MQPSELLRHIPEQHRPEVEGLYAAYVSDHGAEPEGLDAFANVLHERGLLPTAGLHDFLTFHALTLGRLEAGGAPASRYRLTALLGHGAMGEVYVGRDPYLRRAVAVKRAHAGLQQDPLQLQRFLNEAQVTAQLDHPAIVPVYGLDQEADGTLAYAMKLVRGVTLTEYLSQARRQIGARGRPDATHKLKARIETFIPVLNAIAYAHRRGVVHRDLKPDNIMVGSFGEVLVMDWGIARIIADGEAAADAAPAGTSPAPQPGPTTDSGLTIAGTVLGTPAFMSPEQAMGRPLDAASDQYSLGLMLQEVVTLRPAMKADTLEEMLARAVRGRREPIGPAAEPVARELAAIIAKATAPKKEQRYPSVEELAADLKRFLRDESVRADPDRGLRKVKRWIGKHRGIAMALGAGLVALAFAVVVLIVWRGESALAETREAARRREKTMMGLETMVDAQAKRMTERLHRYEALLEGIVGSAALVLSEPAPPSSAVVYEYASGKRDPAEAPSYAAPSKAYQQPASFHADFSAAYGVDRAAARARVDQLARLEPLLQRTMLRSVGEEAAEMPFAEAERLVLGSGAPLIWTYVHTEDGLAIGVPGTWLYDDSPGGVGYDHRREDWYRHALATRGPRWSAAADENGLGLLVNCAQSVRDGQGRVLGVAGLDIWLNRFIEELFEIPALMKAGAETILLDAEGRVFLRSSEKEQARSMSEYVPVSFEDAGVRAAVQARVSGHLALDGGRLAVWTSLGNAGLVYVVIGSEAGMLDAVAASE